MNSLPLYMIIEYSSGYSPGTDAAPFYILSCFSTHCRLLIFLIIQNVEYSCFPNHVMFGELCGLALTYKVLVQIVRTQGFMK